jgi:hypothetical protein
MAKNSTFSILIAQAKNTLLFTLNGRGRVNVVAAI